MDRFVIRGTRGTLPVCGPEFLRYGGDTTCFSAHSREGVLVIDAGTGMRHVTAELAGCTPLPRLTVLFTHLHMDHLVGLPSFGPLYSHQAQLRFMADSRRDENWQDALRAFMRKPYWPIALTEADADLLYEDLPPEAGGMELYGMQVSWCVVPHPQGCLAYRIEAAGWSVVIATDAEFTPETLSKEFLSLCAGADFLVFDTHFTPGEYATHRGWGHSTWETAVTAAERAGVRNLLLTHHAQTRRDEELDAILEQARARFPAVEGASTNLVLEPPHRTRIRP